MFSSSCSLCKLAQADRKGWPELWRGREQQISPPAPRPRPTRPLLHCGELLQGQNTSATLCKGYTKQQNAQHYALYSSASSNLHLLAIQFFFSSIESQILNACQPCLIASTFHIIIIDMFTIVIILAESYLTERSMKSLLCI